MTPTSTSPLQRLLAEPHNLQWQQISLPFETDNAAVALLPQLPSLTAASFDADCLSHFDFLQRLPNLSSVCCSSSRDGFDGQLADRLVAALQHCANITELQLICCRGLSADHLTELLPRLPRLQSLTLHSLDIDSLSFLAQPLTSQLTDLRLIYCTQLPVAELRHVHELRGLKVLELWGSFTASLDERRELLYLPPSVLLPLLESFTYRA